MPNIKSAVKRMHQNTKRRADNRQQRSTMRTAVKKAMTQLLKGDATAAPPLVVSAVSAVDKAAKKGLIHKNKAARHASRMMRRLNALQSV